MLDNGDVLIQEQPNERNRPRTRANWACFEGQACTSGDAVSRRWWQLPARQCLQGQGAIMVLDFSLSVRAHGAAVSRGPTTGRASVRKALESREAGAKG